MNIQHIEEKDYEDKVLNHKGSICVKFYATWCGPCRMLSSVMEDIDDPKYKGVNVVEVNVDEAPNLSRRMGIMSVPTMVFYKDGAEVEKIVGFRNQAQLKEIFDNYI